MKYKCIKSFPGRKLGEIVDVSEEYIENREMWSEFFEPVQETTKNIYKVSRTDDVGYDEYDSFVCIAESEESARSLHPSGFELYSVSEDGLYNSDIIFETSSWIKKENISTLTVEFIGVSNETEWRVVLSSFNAG